MESSTTQGVPDSTVPTAATCENGNSGECDTTDAPSSTKIREGKKARYPKNKKRELKELKETQIKIKLDREQQWRPKPKRRFRAPLDEIERILRCADHSLHTHSVVVDNQDEIVDSSSNNDDEFKMVDGIIFNENDHQNDFYNNNNTLIVRIVSGCNISNRNESSSSVSEGIESSARPQLPEPLPLSSLGHRILTRRTTVRVQPLLVLDLNGILCHRDRIRKRPLQQGIITAPDADANAAYANNFLRPSVGVAALTPIIPRTDLLQFIRFLDRHFCLAIWTSAQPKTAKMLLDMLFCPHYSSLEERARKNKYSTNYADDEMNFIRNKFLFVWSQRQCYAVRPSSGGEGMDNNNGTANACNVSYGDKVVYEKHLSKIWKTFPLWSADNTLLMDDSPEKIPFAISNAVHPPPLNGRKRQGQESSTSKEEQQQHLDESPPLLLDEENEDKQGVFFRKLVGFWNDNSHSSSPWKATAKGVAREEAAEDGTAETMNNEKYYRFLQTHAKGYMGWRESTTKKQDV